MEKNETKKPMTIDELKDNISNLFSRKFDTKYNAGVLDRLCSYIEYKKGIVWSDAYQYLQFNEMTKLVDQYLAENLENLKTAAEFDEFWEELDGLFICIEDKIEGSRIVSPDKNDEE